MEKKIVRAHGRPVDRIRPLDIIYDVFEFATASVLLQLGKTKVLCAVTLQNNVPPFLKGKKVGWLTAEYAMLPTATHTRKERETAFKQNGRSMEISRLIGRVLRSIVDLDHLGERTIVIDCDVIQADGGTRTACISGAFLALKMATQRWLECGKITKNILRDDLAAISVGIKDKTILLDLDFAEDSSVDADFNFVLTKTGELVELQGSAEQKPIGWHTIEEMHRIAQKGVEEIFNFFIPQEKLVTQKPVFNSIRIREKETQSP